MKVRTMLKTWSDVSERPFLRRDAFHDGCLQELEHSECCFVSGVDLSIYT
jgi:hypothetical protein